MAVPFFEDVSGCTSYVYLYRMFLWGGYSIFSLYLTDKGDCFRRAVVALPTTELADESVKFNVNEPVDYDTFNYFMGYLNNIKISNIGDQEDAISTAHITDIFGIKFANSKVFWLMVPGGLHSDERYQLVLDKLFEFDSGRLFQSALSKRLY